MLITRPSFPVLPVYIWLVQFLAFHACGLAFELCDRRRYLQRFKTQRKARQEYTHLLPRVIFNQLFVLLPCMVVAQWLDLCFTGTGKPLWYWPFAFAVMGIGHDITQYATHRFLLHSKNTLIARTLRHSVHHSTQADRGISACYMSSPDFFLEIVLPYLLPLTAVGGGGYDVLFHSLIAGLGALGGVYEHSGYDFAAVFERKEAKVRNNDGLFVTGVLSLLVKLLDNRAHREHHKKGSVSFSDGFGSPGICDTLLGTTWSQTIGKRE